MTRRRAMALGGSLALAACAPTRGADRVSWWAMSQEGENAPLLIPPFTRATGIAVDIQPLPWTAAHEKILTAFAGGSLPDVLMVANSWLPELTLLGALAPLPTEPTLLAGSLPNALAGARVGGLVRASPWITDGWLQFYRRDLIAEVGYEAPPTRWDEWLRMARAIRRRHPDRYATLHLLDWPEPLFALALDLPEPILRDGATRGNFSTPGFRAALAFYKSIFDEKLSPAVVGVQAGDTYIALSRGTWAILPSSAFSVGDLRRRAAMIPRSLWSVAATPGPAGPSRTMATGISLAVTHGARDPERAWRLVSYLTHAATLERLHTITGDMPARADAWMRPALADDAIATLCGAQIARAVAPPAVPEFARLIAEVQLIAERMVHGAFTVEQATVEMDRTADRILAKRRALRDSGLLT